MIRTPLSHDDQVERLRSEIAAHGSLFIAFDFDNTIFDYHNQGQCVADVIFLLKQCSDDGHKMILLTSNEDDEKLAFIRYYCKHYGIRIDYVNENPEVCKGCRKPYYNILIDDRAGINEACEVLGKVIQFPNTINNRQNETTDTESATSRPQRHCLPDAYIQRR